MAEETSRARKGLRGLMERVEKRFGKEAVMRLGDDEQQRVETFSTGSMGLDLALRVGGFPLGRVTEIYGPESSGKTTLTLHALAEAQRSGGTAAFVDAEHALDLSYARTIGVDPARLLVSQPDCGEQALEVAELVARSEEVRAVVVDSVAALTPRAEIEGEVGDHHVGLQARMMSQALRKLAAAAHQNGTAVVFINQLRQKIGVSFGSPETTTGGNALKFYASVRIDIRRTGTLKDGEGNALGNRTRVKVAKNKLGPPFDQEEFDIVYGRGICPAGEVLDLGEKTGVVEKSGSWYAAEGERLGQGRERARAALLEDPERRQRLAARIREVDGRAGPASEGASHGPSDAGDAEVHDRGTGATASGTSAKRRGRKAA